MMYPCDGTTCETIMMVTTTSVYETLNGQRERLEIGYWHSTLEPLRGPTHPRTPSYSLVLGLRNRPASVWEFSVSSLSKKRWIPSSIFGFLPETSLPLRGPPYYVASEISLRQSPARSREFPPSESAAVLPQMIRQYGKIWKKAAKRFNSNFKLYCMFWDSRSKKKITSKCLLLLQL